VLLVSKLPVAAPNVHPVLVVNSTLLVVETDVKAARLVSTKLILILDRAITVLLVVTHLAVNYLVQIAR